MFLFFLLLFYVFWISARASADIEVLLMDAPSRNEGECPNINTDELKEFVKSTGGGSGKYEQCNNSRIKDGEQQGSSFRQYEWCTSSKLGFGRISFPSVEPKLYLRVPDNSNPDMLVHFVEHVWNIPRPKLLLGVTGGAVDFQVSQDLEQILNELMEIARHNDAWIIAGGTRGGIMKYIGILSNESELFGAILISSFCRASMPQIRGKHSIDCIFALGSRMEAQRASCC
jgi:hypothetical protein